MLDFCCEKFQFFYSGEKEYGLNIRIVELSDELIKRAGLTINRSFLITEGYSGRIVDCKKTMTINFCPFCGRELRKFYDHEKYIQEEVN